VNLPDQPQRVRRNAGLRGGHRGDHVTDVANLFAGKNLLVAHISAKGIAGEIQIVAGKYSQHTRHRARLARFDMANPRMRHRAAQHFGVYHPRQSQVAGVNRLARDLLGAVDTTETYTYRGHG